VHVNLPVFNSDSNFRINPVKSLQDVAVGNTANSNINNNNVGSRLLPELDEGGGIIANEYNNRNHHQLGTEAAAAAAAAAAGLEAGAARKPFPKHWGKPPMARTRDLVSWPDVRHHPTDI